MYHYILRFVNVFDSDITCMSLIIDPFSQFIFFSNFPKTCINLLKSSFRIHGYQQWGLSLRLLPNWWGTVPQKLHYYPANALRSLWNDAIFWGKGPYWFQSGYVNKTGVVRGIGWALGQGSCIWIIVGDKCRCPDSWVTLQAMKVSQPKWYNSLMQSITVLCIFCFW